MDYLSDPLARRKEWFLYYTEKRIPHQWFQVHLLRGLDVETVLEIGPHLGLVTAMLDNAGYKVTTLDRLPRQYEHPGIRHIEAELGEIGADRLSGYDCIICCETLEHLYWDDVDAILGKFRASGVPYVIISVPYQGFQIEVHWYLNLHKAWERFAFKKLKFLKPFKFDPQADPHGHKWEVGYRGRSLKDLERKMAQAGLKILRRDFTFPCRSVFFVLGDGSRP